MEFWKKTFMQRPKECFIELLPDEILLKIFRNLTAGTLCLALLVSRRWRSVGEDPSLWNRFPLAIGSQNVKHLPNVLRSARFSHLEQLLLMSFDPYDCEDSNIDTAAIRASGVQKLEIRFVDIRVNMINVASIVDSLTSLTIHCCPLAQEQADQLFRKFQEGNNLEELNIINPLIDGTEGNPAGDGLSKVSPEALGLGLSKIKTVKIHEVCLTVAQLNSVLSNIEREAVMKSVDIYDSMHPKLLECNSELLATSLNKLESLTMYNACLGDSRTLNFLETMAVETNLRHLNFMSNSLRGIPPTTLGKAFSSLTSLNIEDTDISPAQLEAFFQSLAGRKNSPLYSLSIGHNDLSSVDPEIISRALLHVTIVNINATSMTKDQAEEIFKMILMKESSLKELNLNTNDFGSVDPNLMAQAINKLEKVFMFFTGLTESQVEQILKLGLKESNLLHLDLRENLKKNSSGKKSKKVKESCVAEIFL